MSGTSPWIALALLVVTHSSPVVASMALGRVGARPLDLGIAAWDGRPWLGASKTWRGLAVALAAAMLVAALLGPGWSLGLSFGALAMLGDLGSSFLKRRLARPSGADTPLLDQLPESLIPLLVLREPLQLTASEVVVVCLSFALLDWIATRAVAPLRAALTRHDDARH